MIVIVGLLAACLRSGLIEPPELAHLCDVDHGPAWCFWRTLAIRAFVSGAYGYAALIAAALALCWQRVFTASLAATLGVFALIMYCPETGALALLTGCLCLLKV